MAYALREKVHVDNIVLVGVRYPESINRGDGTVRSSLLRVSVTCRGLAW